MFLDAIKGSLLQNSFCHNYQHIQKQEDFGFKFAPDIQICLVGT